MGDTDGGKITLVKGGVYLIFKEYTGIRDAALW